MLFITGSTGHIGRTLSLELEALGASFRAGVRNVGQGGPRAVAFDWEQENTHASALAGCDQLFILTPVAPAMVDHTRRICAAARTQGVKRIVKLSVAGADSRAVTLQDLHAQAEAVVRDSAPSWAIIRSTPFFQNFPRFFGANPSRPGAVYLPHGTGKASWIDSTDVAAVTARVLVDPERTGVFDLTGPEALGTAAVAEKLTRHWGNKVDYVDVPEAAARDVMQQRGVPPWNAQVVLELHRLIRESALAHVTSDVERVLGRRPRSIDDFAASPAAASTPAG